MTITIILKHLNTQDDKERFLFLFLEYKKMHAQIFSENNCSSNALKDNTLTNDDRKEICYA